MTHEGRSWSWQSLETGGTAHHSGPHTESLACVRCRRSRRQLDETFLWFPCQRVDEAGPIDLRWPVWIIAASSGLLGFPRGSNSKESACNAGDPSSIPGSRKSPGEGNDNPLQYSYLENSMDRGAWWTIVHEIAKSDTTEWLTLSLDLRGCPELPNTWFWGI